MIRALVACLAVGLVACAPTGPECADCTPPGDGGDAGSPSDGGGAGDGGDGGDADAGATDGGTSDGGAPALPGETCANAVRLEFDGGQSLHVDATLVGYANDYGPGVGCPGSEGADRVYLVEVPPTQELEVSVWSTSGFDPSLSLGRAEACRVAGRVCVDGDDSGGPAQVNRVSVANPSLDPVLVYVFVDTNETVPGDVSLDATLTPFVPGDDCHVALPLPTDGGTVPGTTAGRANRTGGAGDGGAWCVAATASGGADTFYRADVPPLHRLRANLSASGLDMNLVLLDAASCSGLSRTCLDGADLVGAQSLETVALSNTTGQTRRVYAVVDSASLDGGAYLLSGLVEPMPDGETCENAEPGPLGGTVERTLLGFVRDYRLGDGSCHWPYNGYANRFEPTWTGADRVFSYTLGPGERLEAEIVPEHFDVAAALVEATACTPSGIHCIVDRNSGGVGVTEYLRYSNPTTSPQDLRLIVRARTASMSGRFWLSSRILAAGTPQPPVLQPGDTCDTAVPLVGHPRAVVTGTTAGLADDYLPKFPSWGCPNPGRAGGGSDGVYRVAVPPGEVLRLAVRSLDPQLGVALVANEVATGCSMSPFVCENTVVVDLNQKVNAEAVLWLSNLDGQPREYFVVVDTTRDVASLPVSMPFLLEAEWTPLPQEVAPGSNCATPTVLDAGVRIAGRLPQTLGSDVPVSRSCQSETTPHGVDGVYSVEVPPGEMLTARVQAFSSGFRRGNPFLWLVADGPSACVAPAVCTAGSTRGDEMEQLAWVNTGSAPRNVLLVVGVESTWGNPDFVLETRLDAPPAAATCSNATDLEAPAVFYLPGGFRPSTLVLACVTSGGDGSLGESVYRVVVPAGSTITAKTQQELRPPPYSWGDPIVGLIQGPASNCAPGAALLGCSATSSPHYPHRATWTNTTASPAEVFVVFENTQAWVPPQVVSVELTP